MEIVAIDLYAAIRKLPLMRMLGIFYIRDKCGKLGLLRQKDLSLYLFLFYSSSYLLFLTPLWDGRESFSISS